MFSAASGPTSFLSQTIPHGCVEMLDLSEVYADYADERNPPYHPQMMLKVVFYAYYWD